VALPPRQACIQVALSAALAGRLARPRRLRLGDSELYGHTVAAIPGQGVHLFPARLLWRDSAHAVALDQGRQAARGAAAALSLSGSLGWICVALRKSGGKPNAAPQGSTKWHELARKSLYHISFLRLTNFPILYAISTLTFSTEECLGGNKGSGGQPWIEHTYAPWGSSA
jgi:hypothetical protein